MSEFEIIRHGLSSSEENQRWSAAIAAGDMIADNPTDVWKLIVEFGSSPNEDVRDAVATCLLEHLLEKKFDEYFPIVENEIRSGNVMLGDTFSRCWKFGLSKKNKNSIKWNQLQKFVDNKRGASL